MTIDIKIIHPMDFVRTTADGKLDLALCKRILCETARAIKQSGDAHVLIDVRNADSLLGTLDLYELGQAFVKVPPLRDARTAVLTRRQQVDNAEFAAMVANNRGAQELRVFSGFEEAIDWLNATEISKLPQSDLSAERDIR
jgi:hypothetical protein